MTNLAMVGSSFENGFRNSILLPERLERARRERLLQLEVALEQVLLLQMTLQRVEVVAIVVEAVRPQIVASQRALLLPVADEPGEAHRERIAVVHALDRQILRLTERLVQADGDPGMALVDLSLDGDHVHDREDAVLLVVLALDVPEIREQSRDARVAPAEDVWHVGREERVDLS